MARSDMTVRIGNLEIRGTGDDEGGLYLRPVETDADGDVYVTTQSLYDAVMFVNGDALPEAEAES